MGLSGIAFRVRWYVDEERGPKGCPCSPVGETPDALGAFSKATGWKLKDVMEDGWVHPRMQQTIPEIIASVGEGKPVLVYDKSLNLTVIYGFINNGEKYLIRPYDSDVDSIQWLLSDLGQDPARVILLKEHVEPPPLSLIVRDVLVEAVDGWFRERIEHPATDKLRSGKAALEAWIKFITDFEELAINEELKDLFFHHVWNYQHLYEARKAAAIFLRNNARLYPSIEKELRRVSDLYQEEADLLGSAFKTNGGVWRGINDIQHVVYSGVGTYPDHIQDSWKRDIRQEKQILVKALRLEELSINMLKKVSSKILLK